MTRFDQFEDLHTRGDQFIHFVEQNKISIRNSVYSALKS